MPAKRRQSKHQAHKITAEAVDAYSRGDALALHRALQLGPWQVSPLEVDDGPSPWPAGSAGTNTWPASQELQRQLEAACKARGLPLPETD